jgi:UTP-glucose-1-phosphate uridylyltransferase/mevalonate kinase
VRLFVPGRICLFGEHSDWAGGYRRTNPKVGKGYTLLCGTNQGIYAEVKPHPGKLVMRSVLSDGRVLGPHEVPMEKEALLAEAEAGGFFSYAAGVAYQILTHYHVKGLDIEGERMDLPLKKGLSSSAAICVLVARAFNRIYDLKMTTRGEMEYAYQGEILTPSRCGRMDQGCAFGQRPILMVHDRDLLTVEELRVGGPLHYVIVDLRAGKDTMEILASLNRSYPFPQTDLDLGVHHYLGAVNKEIVFEAIEALSEGDAQKLGALMTKAQRLFDEYLIPACPSQLMAPVLHRLLEAEEIQEHIWGGKGVGSQGDGTAQLLARSKAAQQEVMRIVEEALGMKALALDLMPPQRVRRAIIPAAGFGTRMFPASKAVKKELFPVVDRDGVAKPLIMVIVEEALRAAIEEVCIIVQKGDEMLFDAFFNTPLSHAHLNKLPAVSRDIARRIEEIGRCISFVTQEQQEGFGHAVYCAREWDREEPFLLMLGDHLYRSKTDVSCVQQLLEVYEKTQTSVVGLMRTPEGLIENFGVATGTWNQDHGVLNISEFCEKPTRDYARSNLRVEGLDENEYLTLFGLYILKPGIFEFLEETIEHNLRERGEFQLTPSLDRLRQADGFIGVIVEGERFDTGIPDVYVDTIKRFREVKVGACQGSK